MARDSSKLSGKAHGGERVDNFYQVKTQRHMMQTFSTTKDSSRLNLADPSRVHQVKQLEFFQKHGKKDSLMDVKAAEAALTDRKRAESTLVEMNKGRFSVMGAPSKGMGAPGTGSSEHGSPMSTTQTQMRLERAKLNQQVLAQAEAEKLNLQALHRVKKFQVSE